MPNVRATDTARARRLSRGAMSYLSLDESVVTVLLDEWDNLESARTFNSLECGYSEGALTIVADPHSEPDWLDAADS